MRCRRLASVIRVTPPPPLQCTVDLDASGRATGHVVAPASRDESGWGHVLTPIAVIARGEGPTVLLTGGSHGDEFEGPLALRRLVHEVGPDDVTGRIIVVPGLNQAALGAGRRHSPIDGANMNRVFPGDPRGSVTERVADFVYRELVARADVVVDLHSGGASMQFHPFVASHDLDDERQRKETLGYLEVFGTPLAVIMREPDGAGLLDTAVEELGKVFVTTELGGGRGISARTLRYAVQGVYNTLRHAGVLSGSPQVEAPPRFVRMVEEGTHLAPCGGLFEPLVDPGDDASRGATVARIHDLDDVDRPPTEVEAGADGIVILRHHPGLITPGDPAVAVAVPT